MSQPTDPARPTEPTRAAEPTRPAEPTGATQPGATAQPSSWRTMFRMARPRATRANLFAALLSAAEYCSLGQITHALYEVGGEYRRNI